MSLLFGLDNNQNTTPTTGQSSGLLFGLGAKETAGPTPTVATQQAIQSKPALQSDSSFPPISELLGRGEQLNNANPNNIAATDLTTGGYGARFVTPIENLPWYMRPGRAVNDAIVSTQQDLQKRFQELSDSMQPDGTLETASLTSKQLGAERVAKASSIGLGIVNAAFLPFSAFFKGGEQLPVVGDIFKTVNNLVGGIGQVGSHVGNAVTDALPVTDKTKESLRPVLGETFSLLAQFGLGAITHEVVKSELDPLAKKTQDIIANDENLKASVKNEVPEETQVKASPITEASAAPERAVEATPEEPSLPIRQSPPIAAAPAVVDTVNPTAIDGTGETKVRGLSAGIEQSAIENKLTKSFGDLPEYQTMNIKEQAKLALDLINTNYDLAKKVALGEEPSPQGLHPEAVFTAVEAKAIKEGDVPTLKSLATRSTLTTEATTMGQRIKLLDERNPDSPVKAIRDVARAREEAVKKRSGNVKNEIKKTAKEIKSEIEKTKPKKQDWTSFIREIQCGA